MTTEQMDVVDAMKARTATGITEYKGPAPASPTAGSLTAAAVRRMDFIDEKLAELVNERAAIASDIRELRAERAQLDRMVRATKPRRA